MLKIGLTGGIGSGKSTVRDLLAGKGALVFDADAVAKHVMESDPTVKDALHDVLGSRAWQSDGSLNKPWIASCIFGDDTVRKAVNGIVHPVVQQKFEQEALQAEREGALVIVREAALLPTHEHREALDRLVAVVASRSARLQRVLDRDDVTTSDVEERMRAQPDDDTYAAVADDVIRNDGSLIDLKTKVDGLWQSWMESGAPSETDNSGTS